MKISVTYFPNEAKLNAKTGKIPIYMRVSCKRAKSESRLNIEITEHSVYTVLVSTHRERCLSAQAPELEHYQLLRYQYRAHH